MQQTAHEKGFSAVIEKHIGNGQHVDLLIKTNDQEIAGEISISTSVEHEVENIQKCVSAGFRTIWSISDNADHVSAIESSFSSIQVATDNEIKFYTTDQAQQALTSSKSQFETKAVRGYQLEKSWQDIEETEKDRREKVFAKVTEY